MSNNPIAVNYEGNNQQWNLPKRNTRKNSIRFAQKNYRSSNVRQHANHYLPEKQYAPLAHVQNMEKRANVFTQKSTLRNYVPLVPKSAHLPKHPLLMRNTGARRISRVNKVNRLIRRTNGTRKLFRK